MVIIKCENGAMAGLASTVMDLRMLLPSTDRIIFLVDHWYIFVHTIKILEVMIASKHGS